ncbi:hypothetical protein NL676_021885 [Syzygium grande]|nr:hypothetical protein NL676_021885 [Syzygium grande]
MTSNKTIDPVGDKVGAWSDPPSSYRRSRSPSFPAAGVAPPEPIYLGRPSESLGRPIERPERPPCPALVPPKREQPASKLLHLPPDSLAFSLSLIRAHQNNAKPSFTALSPFFV